MNIGEDLHPPEGAVSKWDRLTYLLAEYKVGVMFTVLSAVVLIAAGRWSLPSLAPWQERLLKAFALGILPSIVLSKKAIVEPFVPDTRLDIGVIDPDTLTLSIQKCSKGLWDKRIRGFAPAYSPDAGVIDHYVTMFDYDEEAETLQVEGCNDEITNPLNIMARNGMLEYAFRDGLKAQSKLKELQATQEVRQLKADAQNVNDLLEAVEHSTRFGGSAFEKFKERDDADGLDADAEERDAVGSDEPPEEGVTLSDMMAMAAQNEREVASNGTQGAVGDD
jgi:hypothetical protein